MRGWVISGGGARIIQALKLIEIHMDRGGELPEMLVGTSAGGLLAFLLSHLGIDGARKEIFKIKNRQDVFQGYFFFGPGHSGFCYSRPLQKIMASVQQRSKPSIPTWVCSFDTRLMKKVYLPIEKNTAEVLASTACIPLLVEPTNGGVLCDGGVVENTPLKFAIDRGADEIEVFMCSADEKPIEKIVTGKIEMFLRVFEAMRNEIALDDLKVCDFKNKAGSKGQVNARLHFPEANYLDLLEFDKMKDAYARMLSKQSPMTVSTANGSGELRVS